MANYIYKHIFVYSSGEKCEMTLYSAKAPKHMERSRFGGFPLVVHTVKAVVRPADMPSTYCEWRKQSYARSQKQWRKALRDAKVGKRRIWVIE
jgi:cyclopropane fatty-acyl-phospholipid synthase-like methyltransferase